MRVAMPSVRIGQPISVDRIDCYPLYANAGRKPSYDLASEAMDRGAVRVDEVGNGGVVSQVKAVNSGSRRVLFLEGEHLLGGKQNRVLNASVMVPAFASKTLPVLCVEAGRWQGSSSTFTGGGTLTTSGIRSAVKATKCQSVDDERRGAQRQQKVWASVQTLLDDLGVHSSTSALADCVGHVQAATQSVSSRIPYLEGAAGLAIAVDGRLLTADLFDAAGTCQKLWERITGGAVPSRSAAQPTRQDSDAWPIGRLLDACRRVKWFASGSIGEEHEFHGSGPFGYHASLVVVDGVVLHWGVTAPG